MVDLYYWTTPNGHKITIFLEETGLPYALKPVNISKGEQFHPDFLAIAPNNRIPAIVDHAPPDGGAPLALMESGAILLYLAGKTGRFYPDDLRGRCDCAQWLFWQMGSAPYLGGGFGHFYAYAPAKFEYPIDRFAMEVKRQLDVLDQRLAQSEYLGGDAYTIADIAVWPWYGALAKGLLYSAGEFLQVQDYKHVQRWTELIAARPAVKRGRMVNRTWGEPASQLHERHEAGDFDTKTADKAAVSA